MLFKTYSNSGTVFSVSRSSGEMSRLKKGLVERRSKPPYVDRRVHVSARLSRSEAVFTIQDEGPGFDPGVLPDPTDPANIAKISGFHRARVFVSSSALRYSASARRICCE